MESRCEQRHSISRRVVIARDSLDCSLDSTATYFHLEAQQEEKKRAKTNSQLTIDRKAPVENSRGMS